jgi:hypothetical protein
MANTVTVLSRGKEGVDLKEFRQLTRDLKSFKPDKQLKKTLRVAGGLIAEDAKTNAEEYSQSIPPSVKVRLRGTSISVIAGGPGVPLAGLFELGNKGKGKSQAAAQSGQFRHPVFGTDTWVEQDMHPFLLRAAARNARSIEHLEGAIVAEAFREAGWR